jgi:hypothetical protein
MNLAHSKTFELLALVAGKAAGMKHPTPTAVAGNPEARESRDLLWADYERVLRDQKTYRLEEVRAWLLEKGVKVSLATADRNRQRVLDRDRLLSLANLRTREFLAITEGADEGEVFAAARKRAGQMLFDLFLRLPTDALEELEPGQILKAFEVAGKLSKAHADVGLIEQRMREARERFEAKAKGVRAKAKDGRLTQDQIDEISREVFGSAA